MAKVVKILFGISDFCAWSLIMFALICVIAFPFIGEIYAVARHESISTLSVIGTCLPWASVALGTYAVTRRRALGLPLVMNPALPLVMAGHITLASVWILIFVLLFGLPFLMVAIDARNSKAGNAV